MTQRWFNVVFWLLTAQTWAELAVGWFVWSPMVLFSTPDMVALMYLGFVYGPRLRRAAR